MPKEPLNIEEEFRKLMQETVDKIKANKEAGLYSQWEAQDLEEKILNILDHGDTSNYGEKCPYGHENIDECGWSPSMGYHCS